MTTVASTTLPHGYKDIPEEDQKKAKTFFERGKTVADTGNYEYAIEMFLQGLAVDPENVEAHQMLREISLKRKASGKGDLGMMDRMRTAKTTKDEKQNLLNAEKLLSYSPGDLDRMAQVLQAALKGGYYDTVLWMGAILMRANVEGKKEDFSKYILLKDTYKAIERFDLAFQASNYALRMKPQDMDLNAETKNLSAVDAMYKGKYNTAKNFRDSIRDMEGQKKLLEGDKDIRSTDSMQRMVEDAEAEWQADPNEPGKLNKLVETLVATGRDDYEARAIQLLDDAFTRTKQFRWRLKRGQIQLGQLTRRERDLRQTLAKTPDDPELQKQYQDFMQTKLHKELEELTEWVDNYPTDSNYRFQMGLRLFALERWDDSIPIFQHVRNDPKYKIKAGVYLGRAFYHSQYLDEAVDTFRGAMEDHQVRGDDTSKELFYWYGRASELKGTVPDAIKAYSQVAQWDFKYRDVQERIKRLRSAT